MQITQSVRDQIASAGNPKNFHDFVIEGLQSEDKNIREKTRNYVKANTEAIFYEFGDGQWQSKAERFGATRTLEAIQEIKHGVVTESTSMIGDFPLALSIVNSTIESAFNDSFLKAQQDMLHTKAEVIPVSGAELEERLESRIVWKRGIDGTGNTDFTVKEQENSHRLIATEDGEWRPSPNMYHLTVALTMESMVRDGLNKITRNASQMGQEVAMIKEHEYLKYLLGIKNNYKYQRKGDTSATASNTYLTSGLWTNAKASNPISTVANLEAAEKLFLEMLDPVTNNPVDANMDDIVLMPGNKASAMHILNATEVRVPDTSNKRETTGARNYFNIPNVYVSKIGYRLLIESGISASNAAAYWFVGNIREAFPVVEAKQLTFTSYEGNKDNRTEVVYDAKMWFTPWARRPFAMVKCYNA